MFPAASLLATLLLAFQVSASPIAEPLVVREPSATLSFARRLNFTGSASIADADRARATILKSKGFALDTSAASLNRRQSSFGVTNTAVTYIASVGVGSPATSYDLLIDTGSSNTWLGADKSYVKTSTSKSTGKKVSVSYGSGSFSGTEYTDTVSLSSALVITGQSIGVASSATGFDGVDGILGIGPVDLTSGTVSGVSSVPTVTDNLLSQGTISTESIGIYYAPTTSESIANGELTFGGVDTSKISSAITYVSLTTTSPASAYWGIKQSIHYGSATGTSILASTAGIVDTGTTLILIATDAYKKYLTATGATLDSTTGLLKITSTKYSSLKSLFFTIGSTSYEITANAQTWPRALNTYIGGSSSSIYLVVGDLGSNSGEGLDFINGYTFLERYYSVYDTTNGRLGFAPTSFTKATTN